MLLAVLTASTLAARDVKPSQREQQEALQEYRKLMTSTLPSVRSLGVARLKGMDFVWRVEELLKVIRSEGGFKKTENVLVVQEAIDVLGTTREKEAVILLMESIIKEKDSAVRTGLMESLGGLSLKPDDEELPWEAIEKVLDAGLESSRGQEVIASVECYGALRRTDKFDLIIPHLAHADWQVRSAVVSAMVSMFDKRHPRGISDLYTQLEEEKGKLRTQIKDALTGMTGWDCEYDVDCWRGKWRMYMAGGGSGAIPPDEEEGDPKARTVAQFFNIELTSDRLLILVDVSSSMLERYEGPEYSVVATDQDWKDNPRGFAKEGELCKWDVAREELISAIGRLEDKQNFNMVFFGDDTTKWKRDLMPANATAKKSAIKKLDSITPSRRAQTNMYGALEAAFRMAGAGVKSELGGVGIDTVVLFTDGYPTIGEISLRTPQLGADGKPIKDDKGETVPIPVDVCYKLIQQTIKNINRYSKVTIHTVGIGDHAAVLLQNLARDSGGKYAKVEAVSAERAKKKKALERDKVGDGN